MTKVYQRRALLECARFWPVFVSFSSASLPNINLTLFSVFIISPFRRIIRASYAMMTRSLVGPRTRRYHVRLKEVARMGSRSMRIGKGFDIYASHKLMMELYFPEDLIQNAILWNPPASAGDRFSRKITQTELDVRHRVVQRGTLSFVVRSLLRILCL